MGLDVSHIQLTLTPKNKDDFFCVEGWEIDCNVPLKYYSKYITTIDDLDFNKHIRLANNEEQFEELKKLEEFSSNDLLKVFVGELNDSMKCQIEKFIIDNKLEKLTTTQFWQESHGISYYSIYFGQPIKVQGMYFTENIGYQRQGMNRLFYEKFKEFTFWGNREDFELAYTCINESRSNWLCGKKGVNREKKNFKENFLDKFEFGKSLLCASF